MSDESTNAEIVTVTILRGVKVDGYTMDIFVNGVEIRHERCNRTYQSLQGALVSARHALNEHFKKEGK